MLYVVGKTLIWEPKKALCSTFALLKFKRAAREPIYVFPESD